MSISATSLSGKKYFLYASNEVPTISTVVNPRPGLITDTTYDDVILFSTNRTIARRIIAVDIGSGGGLIFQNVPIEYARMEYVEMVTPAGVSWVYGLGDDGLPYVELFTSTVPKKRRIVSTLMHRGNMLWVADPRQGRVSR